MLAWFSGIKTYIYGAIAVAFAAMMAYLKYQSARIKSQSAEIDRQEQQLHVVEEYHKDKDKVQEYEADNRVDKTKVEAGDVADITTGTHTI